MERYSPILRNSVQNRFRFAIYEPYEYEDGVGWVQTGAVDSQATAERLTKKLKDVVVRDTALDVIVIIKKS